MKSINKRNIEEINKFYHWNYAHRGLHDINQGVPENSLKAFKLAAEAGYGAELDVQLSKDGKVVVFHDDDLKRVCGIDKRVDEFTFEELNKMSLLETDQTIPLFTEVLETFGKGKGPLIVELKNGPKNKELCEKTYEILKTYKKDFCIESFNPRIVKWFKDNAPEIFRGQLATYPEGYGKAISKITSKILSGCYYCLINKPDFIAYYNFADEEENKKTKLTNRPKTINWFLRKGIMLIAWTSRVPDVDQKINDAVIFEAYRPSIKY